MKRISESRAYGTMWRWGPFFWLVRTRDNTFGLEVVLTNKVAIYFGRLAGQWVFEVERDG